MLPELQDHKAHLKVHAPEDKQEKNHQQYVLLVGTKSFHQLRMQVIM